MAVTRKPVMWFRELQPARFAPKGAGQTNGRGCRAAGNSIDAMAGVGGSKEGSSDLST